MAFLSYDLVAGKSLGPFVLGTSITETVGYLLQHRKSYRRVDIHHHPEASSEASIVVALPEHGLRLTFDRARQRLRLIEIVDTDRLAVCVRGRRLFGGAALPPRIGVLQRGFGPTFPAAQGGDLSPYGSPLLYPGVLFLFPASGPQDTATRIAVFAGSAATAVAALAAAPPACPGRDSAADTPLYAVPGRGVFAWPEDPDAEPLELELGASVQSALQALGPPDRVSRVRGPADGRVALLYPRLGLDLLCDCATHTVARLVLHANAPGSVSFCRVERSDFRVVAWAGEAGGSASEAEQVSGSEVEDGERPAPALVATEVAVDLPCSDPVPIERPNPGASPIAAAQLPRHGPKPGGKKAARRSRLGGAPRGVASSPSSVAGGSSSTSLSSSPSLSTPLPTRDAPVRPSGARGGRAADPETDADSVRGPSEGWSDADDLSTLLGLQSTTVGVQTDAGVADELDAGGAPGDDDGLELDEASVTWDESLAACILPPASAVELAGDAQVAAYECVPLQRDCGTQTGRRRRDPGAAAIGGAGPRRPRAPGAAPARWRDLPCVGPDSCERDVLGVFGQRPAARGGPAGAPTALYAYPGVVFETLPGGRLATVSLFRP